MQNENAIKGSEPFTQNHPFVDGNKRTGFLAGAAFLELNGWMLTVSEPDAKHIIVGLAAGEVSEAALAEWFESNSAKSG